MSTKRDYLLGIWVLMGLTALFLAFRISTAASMDRDGVRYIEQAKKLHRGDWSRGVSGSVDHPVYPLAIAGVHLIRGGANHPLAWQTSAQTASLIASVLWILPLGLIAREWFDNRWPWLGIAFLILAPESNRVLANALSEAWFLMIWTWGIWSASRFLRQGDWRWLILTIFLSGLAYLARPEGLLLPIALVASLLIMPFSRHLRLPRKTWWIAVTILVIGPACVAGPYMIAKGGVGTKPSIAKLIGTAPAAAANAIERKRPLDPNQTAGKTLLIAAKEVVGALRELGGWPLVPLLILGLWVLSFFQANSLDLRIKLFCWCVLGLSALGLIRLHATSGYCAPRHTLLPASLLFVVGAEGVRQVASWLAKRCQRPHWESGLLWATAILGTVILGWQTLSRPMSLDNQGYRESGEWLATHSVANEKILDLTQLALYYASRDGYWFGNLHECREDSKPRWVVIRRAHLEGPWDYCKQVKALVGDREPIQTFPAEPYSNQTLVWLFDLASP